MFKKIYICVFILFIFNFHFAVYWNDDFGDIYKNNLETVCEKKFGTTSRIANFEDYLKLEEIVDEDWEKIDPNNLFFVQHNIVPIYKNNMNKLYNCWISLVQVNTIKEFIDTKMGNDITWELTKYKPKLENQINKLEVFMRDNCPWILKINNIKLDLLTQATYETCRYNFYMEYLKKYYSNPENLMEFSPSSWNLDLKIFWKKVEIYDWDETKKNLVQWLNTLSIRILNYITDEVNQAYKTFPIAYTAYSEYENNYPIHFYLSMTREMLVVYKTKLQKSINPIRQVIYKTINATRK